jgi:hypothetical protein
MLSQGTPDPPAPCGPVLAFLVVMDGDAVASFSAPMAAALVAQRLKREDPRRAVLILVEEAAPDPSPSPADTGRPAPPEGQIRRPAGQPHRGRPLTRLHGVQ